MIRVRKLSVETMDLATQRQLEDLKAQHAPLIAQLTARNQASVKQALAVAGDEFRTHFEGAGFQVSNSYPARLIVKYQTLEFVLDFDESQRIGCWALLAVQQSAPKKPVHNVRLVPKGCKGLVMTHRVGKPDPVADAQRAIQDTQANLAGPALVFDFQIDDPAKSTRAHRAFKNFATFGDLLRDLYK
jgi:hypothetical protein